MGDSWFTVTHFVLKQIHLFYMSCDKKKAVTPICRQFVHLVATTFRKKQE